MSHPLDEVGAAFFIRVAMKNECLVNKWDVRDMFGPQCARIIQNLQRSGCLKVEEAGSMLSMKIVARSDAKRERCRLLGRKRRNKTRNVTEDQ